MDKLINKYSSLIIDNQYFGTVNYTSVLFQFSNIKIDICEPYRKMSFRNRCVVAGSNGLIHLSVPLENGRAQKQPVRDVRISYSGDWQLQHWRTIESCYNRSPFFEYYRTWLEGFFSKRFTFLADMNMEVLEWVQQQVKLKAVISVTDVYLKTYPGETLDLRGYFMPKNFQSPAVAGEPIRYTQVFADRIGFQPNLSVLDLLFCCGPQAHALLQAHNFSF